MPLRGQADAPRARWHAGKSVGSNFFVGLALVDGGRLGASLVAVDEVEVVDSEQMQNRRMQVVHVQAFVRAAFDLDDDAASPASGCSSGSAARSSSPARALAAPS